MVYSPTRADMIEANHPNACNICHTDKAIDWTLGRLKEWYGKTYNEAAVAAHYPGRGRPVALGWLAGGHAPTRLVAADALARAGGPAAVPHLLGALDDPYLLNRQFAAKDLEGVLGVRLAEFGYRFYMTEPERRGPLDRLRRELARPALEP
jgi:hypothetical protein